MASAEAINELSQILQNLVSNDNAIRSSAEQRLNEQWISQRPDLTLASLAHIGQHSPEDHMRSFAIVLLRRIACKPRPNQQAQEDSVLVWDIIPDSARDGVQKQLIVCLSSEASSPVRHKICDTISEIAKHNLGKNKQWPELLAACFECAKSSKPELRESAYRIFGIVPNLLFDQSISSVAQGYAAALQDENGAVRLSALKSASYLLLDLDQQKRNQMAVVMPQMLEVLLYLASTNNEEGLVEAFEVLIDLAECLPKLFRPVLTGVIDFIITLMSNKKVLDDDTRQSALELLVTLAENAPGMMKKTPNFVDKIVPISLEMMTEIEDDQNWYSTDDLNDDDSQENYSVGESSMDRLARALGGNAISAVCFNIITQLLKSPLWNQRHAGLMAISSIGEGCYSVMENQLGTVITMILPYLQDQHPRVRWAACNAIGQMCTDFAPIMQQQYHQEVLSGLVPCLDALQQRVQAHAAAALVNFCEVADKAILEPYLDGIFERLVALLNSSKRYVQEQAIMTIATVADSAQERFLKYYSQMMPIIIRILKEANSKEYRMLKGKAMECASFIAIAVGKPIFAEHAQEVMEILVLCQQSATEPDDPQIPFLLSSWARLCKVLGTDFLPFLPIVLPPLLQSAKLKPDFAVLEEEEDLDNKYPAEDDWEFLNFEGQKIGIKTTVLEEKCTAVEMLTAYAQSLGGAFEPYVEQVLEIVLPLLKFYFHDGVREAAAIVLPLLLSSLKQANRSQENITNIGQTIILKILEVMNSEHEKNFLQILHGSFSDCINVIGKNVLTVEGMEIFTKNVEEQVTEFFQNLKIRAVKRQDVDYDPEDEEAMEEDEATEEMVFAEMTKSFHSIFKSMGKGYLPFFERLIPIINTMWNDNNPSTRTWAICLIDDMIEFIPGDESFNIAAPFLERLNASIKDPAPEPRQAAAYGAGLCGKFGGPQYGEVCGHFLQSLFDVINDPLARSDENAFATDNCISAIAKIIKFKGDLGKFDLNTILPMWISTLPITVDSDEVVSVYGLLLELIEKQHPVVISDPQRLFVILTSAISSKLLKGEIEKQVILVIKHVLGLVSDRNALLNSLSAEQKQSLQAAGFS